MKKTVLFWETNSKAAIDTALSFLEADHTVYSYHMTTAKEGILPFSFETCADLTPDILVMSISDESVTYGEKLEDLNYAKMAEFLSHEIAGILAFTEKCIPMMTGDSDKKIAFLTDAESSIAAHKGTDNYSILMAQAALHMLGKLLFNHYRPDGFEFRCYGLSDVTGGICARDYILIDFNYDPGEPYIHSDENRFVWRDAYLKELPF